MSIYAENKEPPDSALSWNEFTEKGVSIFTHPSFPSSVFLKVFLN